MRRLEDVLRDLAEQDDRLSTDELITRIEQGLSGRVDSSVVALPERPTMDTIEPIIKTKPSRWNPFSVTAGVAALLLLVVGLPLLIFRGGESVVVDAPTTTQAPVTTTQPEAPLVPSLNLGVDSWQRVGGDIMDPVVGLFDMAQVGTGLVAVGYDPGVVDMRQNGVIFRSDDGVTWERLGESAQALTKGTVLIYGITEGGPGMVAVGTGCEDDTQRCPVYPTVWTSVDGTSWTRSEANSAVFTDSGAMLDVVATENGLVAAGNVDEVLADDTYVTRPAAWFSADGLTWSLAWTGEQIDTAESMFLPGFAALTAGPGGQVVGVGMAENGAGDLVAAVWFSLDGRSWERIDPDFSVFAGVNAADVTMINVASTANGYIAVGTEEGTAVRIWLSPDGRDWSLADTVSSLDGVGTLSSIAAVGSGYVATGPHPWTDQTDSAITLWTSPDGQAWAPVLNMGPGYVSEIVANESGIAIAGSFPSEFNVHAGVWAGPSFDPADSPALQETVTFAIPVEGGDGSDNGDGPAVDPTTIAGADVESGDPYVVPPDDASIPIVGGTRVPLGERADLPASPRWDFLASICWDNGCGRDPFVVDPLDDGIGLGGWMANQPFHIRHGFVNESTEPLSDAFDVKVYITRRQGPELDGLFELGQTYEFATDYVVQVAADKCGPGYWEQTETSTCEQFVHEFPEGLPSGRYDIWLGWYAPCSAWQDLGAVDTCPNPHEVAWHFESAVNSPLQGVGYPDDWQGEFDPELLFAEARESGERLTRGW
jgi:hypothetical protein